MQASPPIPRVLTPRFAARVVSRVARGVPIETVAQQLGITDRSVWRWLQQGSLTDDPLSIEVRLRQAVARARAHWEWHQLREIDAIAMATPSETVRTSDRLKALTWSLERRPQTRQRYGIHVDVEHRGTVDHRLKQLEQLDDANLLEIAPPDLKALLEPDT
jgi:hypothetical protein